MKWAVRLVIADTVTKYSSGVPVGKYGLTQSVIIHEGSGQRDVILHKRSKFSSSDDVSDLHTAPAYNGALSMQFASRGLLSNAKTKSRFIDFR